MSFLPSTFDSPSSDGKTCHSYSLPPELGIRIWELCSSRSLWCCSILDLTSKLSRLSDIQQQSIPLHKVMEWQRGSCPILAEDAGKQYIRPTIGSRGLLRIERMDLRPQGLSWRSFSFGYVVEKSECFSEVVAEFKVVRHLERVIAAALMCFIAWFIAFTSLRQELSRLRYSLSTLFGPDFSQRNTYSAFPFRHHANTGFHRTHILHDLQLNLCRSCSYKRPCLSLGYIQNT